MSKKLTTIEIEIPYKRAGGIISQQAVSFDVFHVDGHYELKPLLSTDERRVANLPETLSFTIEDGKPVSLRGKLDGNFHVITDAVGQLQEREQL
jgi:hypothetical protein